MNEMFIYALRDRRQEVVKSVFTAYNDKLAILTVKGMIADLPSEIKCQDDDIIRIGSYDINTGLIDPEEPLFICGLSDLYKEVHRDDGTDQVSKTV